MSVAIIKIKSPICVMSPGGFYSISEYWVLTEVLGIKILVNSSCPLTGSEWAEDPTVDSD